MKNPMVYYAVIALGVIALAAGVYLMISHHHTITYAAFGVGVVLLIAGVVGMFVMKPKSA